jgi:ABC-type multidrug transport system fused ATPase/permease subunit
MIAPAPDGCKRLLDRVSSFECRTVAQNKTEMAADRVIVLEGSSIVEEGAPADLMMRGGAFARLFSLEHTGRLATPGAA